MARAPIFDVIYPRKYKQAGGDERTEWNRIGRAFQTDKGFDVILYSVPVGTNGEIRFHLRESDPSFQRGGQGQGGGGQRGPQVEQRRAPPRQDAPPAYDGPPPDDGDNLPF